MNCKVTLIVCLCAQAICLSGISAGESIADRKTRLAAMSAVEKEQLRQNKIRFDKLAPQEQSRLRRLDAQLNSDPQGDRLREVMLRYSEWLRALPSSQRNALLRLPPQERVDQIRQLLERQEKQRFQDMFAARLQPSDQKVLLDWVSGLVGRSEDKLRQQLLPGDRQRLNRVEDINRRRAMMILMYRWRAAKDVPVFELLKPTPLEINQLAERLSATARETLADARNDDERNQLIQNWVRAALESRMRPQVSKEVLQRFSQEQLTAEQREYLESLPRERLQFELQRMYFEHRLKSSRPGPPFRRPGSPNRQ